jgi:magnesium transporter
LAAPVEVGIMFTAAARARRRGAAFCGCIRAATLHVRAAHQNLRMPDGLRIAGEHATGRVPKARPEQTAGEARAAMLGVRYDCVEDVAVLEGRRLVGLVPLEALVAAADDTRLAELMDVDPPIVTPEVNQESVAWAMVRKHESSVAVVNGEGEFVGLVPPHRMVGVLLAEHDEDVARLGGYLASTQRARQAAEEAVGRRLLHRLPWLLVGLAGAMASAAIVGAFEEQLKEKVLLAVFVPAVVYMADAVGTQTEALMIRGLSVGVSMRRVLRRELTTGLAIGIVVALVFFPFALLVWGDEPVALAVSLALLASCSMATVMAMLLPWLLQRLGTDPAFGSGPLATVIQDLLSIAVYFAVAVSIAA